MTPATYTCARCGKVHTFTVRPEPLPLIFACDCGNKITVDDPILRALPKARPTYRPSRSGLGFWQSLWERARFYIWAMRHRQ